MPRHGPAPNMRAASMYLRSTNLAPRYVLIKTGGSAPMKMISTGPPMPVPNHSAANGTQAIGATNRTASNTGPMISSTQRNQAISRPSARPPSAPQANRVAASRLPPGHGPRLKPGQSQRHQPAARGHADHPDQNHGRVDILRPLVQDLPQARNGAYQLGRHQRGP